MRGLVADHWRHHALAHRRNSKKLEPPELEGDEECPNFLGELVHDAGRPAQDKRCWLFAAQSGERCPQAVA